MLNFMNEITHNLKSFILILSKAGGFSFINQSALNSLGWSLEDLNKNFPRISKLSSNLEQLEALIIDLLSENLNNQFNESSTILRKEIVILGQAFNCYYQKIGEDFILELNPIVYQDLNQVTHEFKRPIQNIKMLIEVLLLGAKDDTKKLDEYLQKLNFEADRLGTLVTDILSFSRLNSGSQELNKTSLDLYTLINDILESYSGFATSKNISLENLLPNSFKILADKKLLEHAVANLIDNAIKYNQKSGQVKIIALSNGFAIEDTGLGMNKEQTKKVFEQFYRIPDRQFIQGSGLGLSLVKKIIDLHGWEIEIDSKPLEGTRFIINFGNI